MLDDLANSIFKEKANDFLKFIQSPSQNISLNFDYKTLLQIAENLHIPFGYLFLESLPKENRKVAELRRKNPRHQISQTLQESIKESEYKQLWYRDYLIENGQNPQYTQKFTNKEGIINKIKSLLNFEKLHKKPYEALNQMIEQLQKQDFLIFIASRINRSNNKKLSIEDFRGYCLYDHTAL